MALLIIINYILAVTVFPLLLSVREKLLVLKCCGRTPCERRFGFFRACSSCLFPLGIMPAPASLFMSCLLRVTHTRGSFTQYT